MKATSAKKELSFHDMTLQLVGLSTTATKKFQRVIVIILFSLIHSERLPLD